MSGSNDTIEFVNGLVSTVIPVHNRPLLVEEAIDSVLSQTYRPIEIVVVDDGSTDDTPEVLETFSQRCSREVRVVYQRNQGPGVARETGRRLARGEFIQYLDSDDLLLPRKFESQIEGLRSLLECQVSYGITRCYDYGKLPDDSPCKRTGERIESMFPSFLESRWWSTSTPLYRREVTDQVGPWKPLWNEEDWEYDCRVAALGGKLHYCPEFVSDTRRGRDDQLCSGGNVDPSKLSDRAEAHRLILHSAERYGIGKGEPEMQHFARELFLLSRQCGAAGLERESEMLFELAYAASDASRRRGLDFTLYRCAAAIFGWNMAGRLAANLDRARRPDSRSLEKAQH